MLWNILDEEQQKRKAESVCASVRALGYVCMFVCVFSVTGQCVAVGMLSVTNRSFCFRLAQYKQCVIWC